MRLLNNSKLHICIIVLFFVSFNYILYRKSSKSIESDSLAYKGYAIALLNNSNTYNVGTAVRKTGDLITPGYPAYIALHYLLFGEHENFIYASQFLLSLVSIILFYFIAAGLFGNNLVAFISTLWTAAYWPLWQMNFILMKEILCIFYFTALIFYLQKYIRSYKLSYIIICGILFSLLVITNVKFVVLAFVLGVYLIFLLFKYKRKSLVSHIAAYSIFILITVIAWNVRQSHTFGHFVLFNPGRMVLLNSNDTTPLKPYEYYRNKFTNPAVNANANEKRFRGFTKAKYDELKLKHEQKYGIKLYYSRFFAFWETVRTNFELEPNAWFRIIPPQSLIRNLTEGLLVLPMFIFGILGFYFSIRKKEHFVIILVSFILSYCLLHTFISYNARYRLLVIPIIFLAGWYGIYELYKQLIHRRKFAG